MARTTHTTSHSDSGILSRLRTRPAKKTEHYHHETEHHHPATKRKTHGTKATAHHHKRKPTVGDKISGAMMKAKGEVTRRPGVKGAGTRRMHGTDGKVKKRK